MGLKFIKNHLKARKCYFLFLIKLRTRLFKKLLGKNSIETPKSIIAINQKTIFSSLVI
mgnify:CR=1 FL=1